MLLHVIVLTSAFVPSLQVSVAGPNVACILLTHAGPKVAGGIERGYGE